MKPAVLALLLAALSVPALVSAPALGADSDASPSAAMRTLQTLQEQIAHGNATAQAAQPQLMAHIADGFAAADPAVWQEPRNARAAILFLLSGGRPDVIRAILAKTSFPPDLDRLLKGALAYAEGEDEIARVLLGPIDPQALPSGLGAHLSVIKAGLLADQDAGKAIKMLDNARLLAPGTLIEEAALRREVFLLIDKGEVDKAMLLARQYLRRYRASTYADNFRQRFVAAAVRMAVAGNTAQLSLLDAVLGELPTAENRLFYLTIAKTALLEGKMPGAQFAARKAAALAAKGTADETRAKLYLAASAVVAEDPSPGLFALAAVNPQHLTTDDLKLREAALALGAAIRAETASPGNGNPDEDGAPAAGVDGTIAHARTALDDSARLLAASQP